MTKLKRILDIQYTSSNIVKNSKELKINAPENSPNAAIHSTQTITTETNTLTKDVVKILDGLIFNEAHMEYIKLANDIAIKTPAISICFWVYIKYDLGSNNAIIDFAHKDDNGKFSNKIAVKTGEKGKDKIIFMINNTTVLVDSISEKWMHYCWTLDSKSGGLADWKIIVNGNTDSGLSFSNKTYLNKDVVLNNNLIGKSESDPSLLGFNGKMAGITIYEGVINPNLDIYSHDPTIKYIMMSNKSEEGFRNNIVGGISGIDDIGYVTGTNSSQYDLYDNGMVVDSPDTEILMDVPSLPPSSISISGNYANVMEVSELVPVQKGVQYEYENVGLGIFFICITIVLYKYF
jgi:hypothetical protein